MAFIQSVIECISNYHLLKHQFYQAWSRGELSRETLQRYAAQYYHQVKSFPRFISRVHSMCPEIEARKVLLNNLVDEEIHGTDHPALWMQFAEGLGLKKQTVVDEIPLAETEAMVNQYYSLAEQDWRSGLCALYAYEYQVPAISASKIEGLKAFYDIEDPRSLAFFEAHQIYDVEHANQVAQLIEKYVEPDQALQATKEAAGALWSFLDGMCRACQISC